MFLILIVKLPYIARFDEYGYVDDRTTTSVSNPMLMRMAILPRLNLKRGMCDRE